MRRWFRTDFGKTVLFLLCGICVILTLLSAVGIAILFEADVYTKSQQSLYVENTEAAVRNAVMNYCWEINLKECRFVEDRGNLIFEVVDSNDQVLVQSAGAGAVSSWDYYFLSSGRVDGNFLHIYGNGNGSPQEQIYIHASLKQGLPETDSFRLMAVFWKAAYALRYWIYAIAAAFLLLSILCFVSLMRVAGRKPGDQELHPGYCNKIPGDVFAGVLLTGIVLAFAILDFVGEWYYLTIPILLVNGNLFLWLCMNMAVRIKEGSVFSNTLCWKLTKLCFRFAVWLWFFARRYSGKLILGTWRFVRGFFGLLGRGLKRLPLVWETALILSLESFVEMILVIVNAYEPDNVIGLWFFGRLLLFPLVLWIAYSLRKLEKGAEHLAAGDLSYYTDTKGLHGPFKTNGEHLNNIALGMGAAVEQRLKSERMKTELITNVSHDIKTPLTSIINYSDLIAQEPCDNAQIGEYAEVLVQQSQRLKRLLEDLVEASKASTGNLDVELMPCEAGVLLSQISGEYESKFAERELTLVTKAPETELRIMADGRRMWRIFDNLMNNICKYALPGTRVYLNLEAIDGNAVFSFKNISAAPLNISEEELMERFTRGDESRSTEGNGLGLSIAGSLAKLQGGELKLQIDGDLFKAILTFPLLP